MRILFIGPLPPPLTGHSLACKVLVDELVRVHAVDTINLSKEGFTHGVNSWARIAAVLRIILDIWRKQRHADIIYLTLSESVAGNIKDVLIYLVCLRRLSRMIVHLHGGSLRALLFDRHPVLFAINRFCIGRLGGVIVLGPTHVRIFEDLIAGSRIHIVPNFAEDYLFASRDEIVTKFGETRPLRILFLSNLIEGKGFADMVAAYRALGDAHRDRIQIDFAGACESDAGQGEFLRAIQGCAQVRYHGPVDGARKRDLLVRAHVLCLPTSLSEGQPVSILEAYAAGCVVITTDRGGIRDVFRDGINGFEVEPESAGSLARVFDRCLSSPGDLMAIAMANADEVRSTYRTSRYSASILQIFDTVREGAAS